MALHLIHLVQYVVQSVVGKSQNKGQSHQGVLYNDGHQTCAGGLEDLDPHQTNPGVLGSNGSISNPGILTNHDHQSIPDVVHSHGHQTKLDVLQCDGVLCYDGCLENSDPHQTSPGVLNYNGSTSNSGIHANDDHQSSPGVLDYNGSTSNPGIHANHYHQSSPDVVHSHGHQTSSLDVLQGDGVLRYDGHQTCAGGLEVSDPHQTNPENWALHDVFIMSDDKCWKEDLLSFLKENRPHLKCTSEKDWISGRSKINNLIISTERSKLVVIGFQVKPETDYPTYAAHSVIVRILEAQTLDDARLILVKLSENAEIPSCFRPLTGGNDWEEDFRPALLRAVDECDAKDTPLQGNVKDIIARELTKHMRKELVEEYSRDWSLNIEKDRDSTVVSNKWETDICIVSGDNEWETEVCKMLREKQPKLNVISRSEFFSTYAHPHTLESGASAMESFMKCANTSKKVVVGYGTNNNGYPNRIAAAVFKKLCDENKHFEQLIPVKLSTNAVLAECVKHLTPLEAINGDVVDSILKTLDVQYVNLKVCNKNKNSENFATIEDKLKECVEDFQDRCNPLLIRIKDYFSEKGLMLNGITIGCILLHLSAPDAKTLQCLSDFDIQREIMEKLAELLLPQRYQVEFTQEWSINFYNGEKGCYERTLDKHDGTLPSVAAVASISSDSELFSGSKDELILPPMDGAAGTSSGSDERTLDKDDGTLPSVAAVASIPSGSDLTPLDNDDKTLSLVASAPSLLSSDSEILSCSKDEIILPSMTGAAGTSSNVVRDLRIVNIIQACQGSDERTLDKDDGTLPSVAAVASIPSGISNDDFIQLVTDVSTWYDDRKCVSMLKVLYRDLVTNNLLNSASETRSLLELLYNSGDLGPTDLTLLYDTIKATKQLGLEQIIKDQIPSCPNIREMVISRFTPHRQKLITLGMALTQDDVFKINGLFNNPVKKYADSWSLIMDLENKMIICEKGMDEFVAKLKRNAFPQTLLEEFENVPPEIKRQRIDHPHNQGSYERTFDKHDGTLPSVATVASIFSDDTIRDYLLKKMKKLCSKAKWFTPATWSPRYEVDIAHMFTDLYLLKENRKTQDATPATFQDVLDIIKSTPACRVVIEGEGGIGKSTLLRFLAYNWANDLDETFKGKLLFLVNIRDIDKGVLDAIIKLIGLEDFEVKTDIEQGSKLIKRYIRNHDDEIVLLLDGLDELKDGKKSPISLFKRVQLENSKVIITSQSEEIDEFITESDIHVKVKGFNESNIRNYIKKYFEYWEKPALGDALIKELGWEYKKYEETYSMCKNPMLLPTVCSMWEDKQCLPADKSDLFKEVFLCILNQYIDKYEAQGRKISIFEKTPLKYLHAMLVLGQCIYESLKRNKLSLNKDDMEGEEQVVKLALELGFVYKDVSIYKDDFEEVFTSPHKLIVESLVGFYLNKVCQDDCFNYGFERRIKLKPLEGSEWEVIRINEHLKMAREFAMGFLGAEAGKFLKHWITNSLSTCRPLMTYLDQVNEENRIHVEKTIIDHISESDFEMKPHITEICNSLWSVIHHIDPNVNDNWNFLQLMRRAQDLRHKIMGLLETSEFIQMSPEILGKMMAHLFIAVEDQNCLLEDNVHLSNEHVVKVLLNEFKKLCFQYDITSDLPCNTCHPLLLFHILFNASNIIELHLVNCNLTGCAMNAISKEYASGVVLKLTRLFINDNNLSAIEGTSLASLFAMAPKLCILTMSNCNLSGVVMNDMVRVCFSRRVVFGLGNLSINDNNLSAIEGTSLASLLVMAPKLYYLNMDNCMLSGGVMNDMVRVCSSRGVVLELMALNINDNDLSAIESTSLASLLVMAPNLKELTMSNCNLSGVVMNDMVKVCCSRGVVLKLQRLYINDNDLSAIEGTSLASLLVMAPKLYELTMSNCRLTDVVMNYIIKLYSSRGVVLEMDILASGKIII